MYKKLLEWWIYLMGIRFYETNVDPISVEVIRVEFRTVKDQLIKFLFFREAYRDTVYRRGIFYTSYTHAFIIQAQFDQGMAASIIRFNRTKYFFRGHRFLWFTDQDVADTLLEIYLKFIATQIK